MNKYSYEQGGKMEDICEQNIIHQDKVDEVKKIIPKDREETAK